MWALPVYLGFEWAHRWSRALLNTVNNQLPGSQELEFMTFQRQNGTTRLVNLTQRSGRRPEDPPINGYDGG